MVQQTKFALDVGARLFEFFENYFQIKYPMPKLGKYVSIYFYSDTCSFKRYWFILIC